MPSESMTVVDSPAACVVVSAPIWVVDMLVASAPTCAVVIAVIWAVVREARLVVDTAPSWAVDRAAMSLVEIAAS